MSDIYIYIYCHLQTESFVVSQLFSVARHVGRLKLGSKPAQLYVRLSIRPLGQQAYHVGKELQGINLQHQQQQQRLFVYILYLTGYFVRRDLHYANCSRKFLLQSANPHGGACIYIYIYIYIY